MALPVAPVVPMTAAQYAALPEDAEIHYELQDGILVPMASPDPEHQVALLEFAFQLRPQLLAELSVVPEFLFTGSVRTDQVIKRGEYADAGVAHYWMIDLADGPSLVACHRAGEFGYQDAPAVRGVFTTEAPFPVRIDLDALG